VVASRKCLYDPSKSWCVLRGKDAVRGSLLLDTTCISIADRAGAVCLENSSLVSCEHVASIAHALSDLAVPFSPTFAGNGQCFHVYSVELLGPD
jgi:hypothetical protein